MIFVSIYKTIIIIIKIKKVNHLQRDKHYVFNHTNYDYK